MHKSLFMLAIAVILGGFQHARAGGYLDVSIMGGSIGYGGGNAPLFGSGIIGTSILGEDTPIGSGRSYPLPGKMAITFETGGFSRTLSDGWEFAAGGSLFVNEGSTNLIRGVFDSPTDVVGVGNDEFKVLAGDFKGTINGSLASYYGITLTTGVPGGISVLFDTFAQPGGHFVSTLVNSGNIAVEADNTSSGAVPEPNSIFLGLSGIGLITSLSACCRKRAS